MRSDRTTDLDVPPRREPCVSSSAIESGQLAPESINEVALRDGTHDGSVGEHVHPRRRRSDPRAQSVGHVTTKRAGEGGGLAPSTVRGVIIQAGGHRLLGLSRTSWSGPLPLGRERGDVRANHLVE